MVVYVSSAAVLVTEKIKDQTGGFVQPDIDLQWLKIPVK